MKKSLAILKKTQLFYGVSMERDYGEELMTKD